MTTTLIWRSSSGFFVLVVGGIGPCGLGVLRFTERNWSVTGRSRYGQHLYEKMRANSVKLGDYFLLPCRGR